MGYNETVGIDLHVHSTASDGSLSPVELLALAGQMNLAALAITDHDTVDGSKKAVAAGIPDHLHFLTGLEMSAAWPPSFSGSGSFHMLGYGVRLDDPELNRTLKKLQTARAHRNPQIIARLNTLKMPMDMSTVRAEVGDDAQLGRPHIAAVMVRKGYVASINEAFDRFLGTGKPAYVDKYRVSCARAIEVISAAGGIPVLAHPCLLNITQDHVFDDLIVTLASMGLKGIEAHYPEHTQAQTAQYRAAAKKHALLVTGGTDYHGDIKPDIQLGSGTGNFHVPYELYETLVANL